MAWSCVTRCRHPGSTLHFWGLARAGKLRNLLLQAHKGRPSVSEDQSMDGYLFRMLPGLGRPMGFWTRMYLSRSTSPGNWPIFSICLAGRGWIHRACVSISCSQKHRQSQVWSSPRDRCLFFVECKSRFLGRLAKWSECRAHYCRQACTQIGASGLISLGVKVQSRSLHQRESGCSRLCAALS